MNILTTRRGRIAVSWIVCLTLVVASFAGPFSLNNAQASAVAPPITVDKEVVGSDWVDKDLGIAKVKLTVDSKDIETTINTPLTTRIVLVLDYSGSMEGSKISTLKEVATDFIDDMLLLDRVEIGVVLFNSSVMDTLGFTDDADALKDIIEDNDADGATLTQAGIRTAQTMLNGVVADNEYMIVLSDGVPTLSYKGTAAREATQADRDLNFNDGEWPFVLTSFSNDIVGSGGDYGLNTWYQDYRYYVDSYRVTNNGYATVSEALLVKQEGTTIFSVGFGFSAGSTEDKVMKSVASSDDKNFLAGVSDLSVVFDTIHSEIVDQAAGTGAVVTDPMGFNTDVAGGNNYTFKALIDATHPVVHTEPAGVTSSVNYDGTTDTFDWILTTGDIKEGTYTLEYYVQIQDVNGNGVGDNVGDVLTNHQAVLEYTDAAGAPQSIPFIDPVLQVEHYTVAYYFDGVINDSMTETQSAIAGRTPVTVVAPSFPGYDYEKTVYGNDSANTALDIIQDGENNIIKIYYIDKPEEPGTWTPDVTKMLNGKAPTQNDLFQFTINEVTLDDQPKTRDLQYSETVWNIGDMVPFSSITYDEPGTFTYEISEANGNVPGFTYDSNVISVTVVVTEDDDNNLVAEATYEGGQVFYNTYEGPGTITVDKEVVVLSEDPEIAVNYTFYAALFEDQDGKMVLASDVKALQVIDSATATATFDNLDLDKTYYVFETDEDGNIIETAADGTILTPIIPDWTSILYDNAAISLTANSMGGEATITNVFDPEDFPLFGSVTVNKTVMVNDKAFASNRTFYVALFADKELTEMVSDVEALKMNGKSSTTIEILTDMDGNPLEAGATYYIAETDKDGMPLTGGYEELGFDIDIDQAEIVIAEEGTEVNIINKFQSKEFPLTGDNSNMNLWLFLALLGVAGAIAPFAFRKKEVHND